MRRCQFVTVFVLGILLSGHTQTKVIDVGKDNIQITNNLFYSVGGEPISNTKYIRVVAGSPYYYDDYLNGKIALGDGRMYDSLRLKLDMVEHTLLFISQTGKELAATVPVKGVTLIDSVTGRQHHFIYSAYLPLPKNMEKGWYEILASGKVIMYKYTLKDVKENKPYGSATTEQTIENSHLYYVFSNNTFTRVKKLKDIPDILAAKKEELKKYIDQRKLSGKQDTDYADLVTHFNKITEIE